MLPLSCWSSSSSTPKRHPGYGHTADLEATSCLSNGLSDWGISMASGSDFPYSLSRSVVLAFVLDREAREPMSIYLFSSLFNRDNVY